VNPVGAGGHNSADSPDVERRSLCVMAGKAAPSRRLDPGSGDLNAYRRWCRDDVLAYFAPGTPFAPPCLLDSAIMSDFRALGHLSS